MDQVLRLLMVEDQALDAELLQRELRRGGINFLARRVCTKDAFLDALAEFEPDLILSDYNMPTFDGLTALGLAHAQVPEVPFIFVSGTIGEDRAVEALTRGAIDYVLKDRPKRLLSAVSRALEERNKRVALRESQNALQASEGRFRSFMQHLPARASICNVDGQYTFVNAAWQCANGGNVSTALGRAISEVLPAQRANDLQARHRKVIETNSPLSATFQTGAEGQWWFSTCFPIPDAAGNVAAVGTVSVDVTEQKLQEEKLNYLAYYDALTGLPNRACLHARLTAELKLDTKDRLTALIVVNVNRFGVINESLGRRAGDDLLRELADRFRKEWPGANNLARLNADCFAGLVVDYKDEADIAHTLETLAEKIFGSPFIIEGQELIISMTAGIAASPADGADADTLLQNAEAAMRQAKASSVRCLFYQRAMNATVAETLILENRLRHALHCEEFVLHYQPKINLASGKIVGLEALIRWNKPESGLVPPIKFIPLLEETGLIIEVGKWALRRALTDYRAWHEAGLQPPRIAVNVSAIQLAQENFVDVVRGLVSEFGADSCGLDLEITESLLMKDVEANIVKLRAIREMGIAIAVDDFGTGYSSLGYLAKLPVDALKIDRSFVITMADEADGMAIASTIISLARSLDLKVIAEGVETEEQRRLLRLLKCDQAQGYLFHRPLPEEAIADLLRA